MRSTVVVYAILTLAALLLTVDHSATASEITHFSDDFEGGDGPLDARRWEVTKLDPGSNISILDGSARMRVMGWDRVTAIPDLTMDTYPFMVEFMWLQEAEEGHTLEIQVVSSADTVRWVTEDWIYYKASSGGWYHGDPTNSEAYQYTFSEVAVQVGTWYRVVLTVEWSRVTIQVFEPGTEEPVMDNKFYSVMDQFATVRFGAWADTHAITAARIDDVRVYVIDPGTNDPIEVDPIPDVALMEDEFKIVDLAPFVHDPDGDESDIRIETTNHRVVDIDGLNVTLLCLEEGGSYEIRLTFTDGVRFTDAYVGLNVQGVNDPPRLTLVSPMDGQTLFDVEHLRIEYQITDPDSFRWDSYVRVQGVDVEYFWESNDVVGSSKRGVDSAPYIVPGMYTISVTVTDDDAQDSVEATVYVEISESPAPAPTPESFDSGTFAICLTVVLIGSIIISAIVIIARPGKKRYLSQAELDAQSARRLAKMGRTSSHRASQRPSSPPPSMTPRQAPFPAPPPAPAPAPPPAPAPAPPPAVVPAPPPVHSSPVAGPMGDWRVSSVDEFMALIPVLPEGFPEALWGIPQHTVGRQVVDSSTLGPDGRPVCYVNDIAFHADKGDLSTFLQPV